MLVNLSKKAQQLFLLQKLLPQSELLIVAKKEILIFFYIYIDKRKEATINGRRGPTGVKS